MEQILWPVPDGAPDISKVLGRQVNFKLHNGVLFAVVSEDEIDDLAFVLAMGGAR